jgi:uncharacterized protein (TIGR03790 family)
MKLGVLFSRARRAAGLWLVFLWGGLGLAQEPGSVAVVVYNKRVSDSKKVALHYAKRREVPPGQIVGFDLPETETMTRQEYDQRLRLPLLEFLKDKGLLTFHSEMASPTNGAPPRLVEKVVAGKIRYIVLCFGVPLYIQRDPSLNEPEASVLSTILRPRNEAAVDSELALLAVSATGYPLSGPLTNPFYGATNGAVFNPTNHMLMVARLDGPTFAIANALVDKAMLAEEQGLWGRAYFDLRGLTAGDYKIGDDWLRTAAEVCRILGFETVVDTRPETFPPSFPMSQIAFYAGWYDADVSGPFTRPKVEFMPGAVAYHLHSFSGTTLRSVREHWVGPLLAKGATATLGSVDEPYLGGTPNIGLLFSRLVGAECSFGEASYASMSSLSWQTTVVGDPLYRPFAMSPQKRHEKLVREGSKLVEWSLLRVVDMNLAQNMAVDKVISFLEDQAETKGSAVLMEKLGDLYEKIGKPSSAIYACQAALKLNPSPLQVVRLLQTLAERFEAAERFREARDVYSKLFKEYPDYGDRDALRTKIVEMATKAGG